MNERIKHLAKLGEQLRKSPELTNHIQRAEGKNPWFIELFVKQAVDAIIEQMLDEKKLNEWLGRYELKDINKTIGLIFAGNIPLVGFHDFLCCYVAGCKMKIKLSSKDDSLFPLILKILSEIDSSITQRVEIVDKLKDFDAVIATGSDNTNRYFEYYFRDYPKVLRKNRNSVAILTGEEQAGDLEKLASDVFDYFGFGCRNVSKLFVPVGYDFTQLFPHFEKYKWIFNHSKYMNNYDYNRTVLLLNKTPHYASEFLMAIENPSTASPIATLHYEFWHDENILNTRLKEDAEKIQCIVSLQPEKWKATSSVNFGQSQQPELWDYADGVDTLKFLLGLS